MKTIKALLLAFLVSVVPQVTQAQNTAMADELRSSGKIYVVVAVMTTIFLGIAIYLVVLDRRLRRLEKESKNKKA